MIETVSFTPKGVIYDVDDTLLDNQSYLAENLHARSRLAAVRQAGKQHGIAALAELPAELNRDAYRTAVEHSLEGAIWNIFHRVGLVHTPTVDHDNPLVQEIVASKSVLHAAILRDEGEAFPGAVEFVINMAKRTGGRQAIASSAIRSEIDIFLTKVGLGSYFSDRRIISRESVTRNKPDPQSFNLAFESLGLSETARPQVCAIEDDPRGILAAQEAGLYVCALTTYYPRDHFAGLAAPPDFIAENYAQLSEHFGLAA